MAQLGIDVPKSVEEIVSRCLLTSVQSGLATKLYAIQLQRSEMIGPTEDGKHVDNSLKKAFGRLPRISDFC